MRKFTKHDLVEGPIAEKPLTEEIKVGQSYRTRDNKIITIHIVEPFIGTAGFLHKGVGRSVFSGTLSTDNGFIGRNNKNVEDPCDLVERIKSPMNTYCDQDASSTLAAQRQQDTRQDRESLATSINEALERVERGDKPLDQNGATLNHKELVLALVRGNDVQWVNKSLLKLCLANL